MWKQIKLILKSVRQYKKAAIITPIFMLIEVAMETCLPFVMSMFIETIQNTPVDTGSFFALYSYENNFLPFLSMDVSLFGLIITMVSMAIVSIIGGIGGGIFAAKASVGLGKNLRSDLYRKVESFSFANIDKFQESSLITRMTTDIQSVQMAFQMCIRIVVRAPLMLIFSTIMAFVTGGPMAWIFIGLIPLVCFGLFLIIINAMKIFRRVFKKYDILNESVQENVSGIRVVKSFVREDFEKKKFTDASNGLANDFIKAEKIVALNNPLMNTTIHLSNILILGIGSYMIFKKNLEIGQMSALITYGIQILMSLMMISIILVMLVMSLEAVKRIGEILQEEPTIKNPENPIFDIQDGSVDFNHVNFKYSEKAEKNALENIDIHIKSGQFVGILGSTGSGKTSLVNLISRLYDVSEGEILVGGHDVRDYDLVSLRDSVAVVLQKNVLFSGTVSSNLRWGNENASEEEMIRALQIAQTADYVMAYPEKLEHPVEQGGANFSGGQKQRLCIARAILKKPKILILDDSTSAVDTKTDKLIRKSLKEDLPDMTKIVIAQRISSIEDADQIIIMDDGKINAVGTHEELLKNNIIYQEVYHTQNRVGGDR